MENKLIAIQWLINKIEQELSQSTTSTYKCTDGTLIKTDVGYVEDWWKEYKANLLSSFPRYDNDLSNEQTIDCFVIE